MLRKFKQGFKSGLMVFLGLCVSGLFAYTVSGTIKTWTTGDTLTATDLNTTVQSLKTAVEGASQYGEQSQSLSGAAPTFQYAKFSIPGTFSNASVSSKMLRAGTVKSFSGTITTNTLDGSGCTLTLQKNGVDTAISVSIPNGSTAAFSDTDTVNYVANDTLRWKMTCNGTTSGTIQTFTEFEF